VCGCWVFGARYDSLVKGRLRRHDISRKDAGALRGYGEFRQKRAVRTHLGCHFPVRASYTLQRSLRE
jgi:hypothetical protein